MYDQPFHSPDHAEPAITPFAGEPTSASAGADPQVIWVETPAEAPATGREADPYEVIEFLLAKAEEQQAKLADQAEFVELQHAEIAELKARNAADREELAAARAEIAAQLADYEVLMQNILATERELDHYKQRASERPKIQLPFHAEQKLAQLGFNDEATQREAV